MSYFFLALKILLGVGFVVFYVAVLHPFAVGLLYKTAQKERGTGRPRRAVYLLVCLAALLLPLGVPRFLAPVRLFYAAMAVGLILKLISYLREHGWPARLLDPGEDFLEFMSGYAVTYPERPEPFEDDESVPRPAALARRAALVYALVGSIAVLDHSLGLRRAIPLFATNAVTFVSFVLLLQATQDAIRVRLLGKGLKPELSLVDLRLFWSKTYELAVSRTNPMLYRWLLRYVYVPLGGKNHPARTMLVCCLLGGVIYEYMLASASMRLSGLWLAYFAAHGLLIFCESLWRPRRERLFLRLGERSLWYQGLVALLSLLNLALTLAVAQLLSLGLDQVIRLH
jgi:hypothetical protein